MTAFRFAAHLAAIAPLTVAANLLDPSRKEPAMTATTNTAVNTATGHLVIRCDGWVGVFDLGNDFEPVGPRGVDALRSYVRGVDALRSYVRGVDALRSYVRGADYAGEPIGDAWHIGADGEPVRLTVHSYMTPFDDDDYATRIVAFARDDRSAVVRVSYRVDGRA